MFQVLNMSLQIMRTVLKNEINEVSVCSDMKSENGTFYTLISITDGEISKEVAKLVNTNRLFSGNRDFVGSFTYQSSFNLVFVYRQEARLADREALIAETFAQRKALASGFLVACAETGAEGPIGELLLCERNIHVAQDKKVYFNYFLDFKEYDPSHDPLRFFTLVAEYAFDILAREYSMKYDRHVDNYPQELQAFFKKKQRNGFTSFNQILTFIKMIPDKPTEQHFGIRRLWDRICYFFSWVKQNSMALFVVVLVTVTVVFASVQIYLRLSVRRENKVNTSYAGLENIGEVYLGDEDV